MRVCVLVAYDGTDFHGWARQPGELRTVQGALEAALAKVCGAEVPTTCAGRTDAGVHARGQVVSCDVPDTLEPQRLTRSLDRLTPDDVTVRAVVRVPDDVDARFSAVARRYRYRLSAASWVDPLTRRSVWVTGTPLDAATMHASAQALVGEHDFAAFCKTGASGGTVRRVLSVDVAAGDDGIVDVHVEAQSFCHQMVRSVVGALAVVGSGRRPSTLPAELVASGDRAALPQVAPPHGLVLWAVRYPPEAGIVWPV